MKKIKKLSDLTKRQLASFLDYYFDCHFYKNEDRYYDHSSFRDNVSKIKKDDLIQLVESLFFIEINDGHIKLIEKKK